jgi:peptidoglycan/LPS O-acetylase OafA/YrhL
VESSSFRQDIQGLRGLAVLAVVAYHAQLPVPGGFVGVDMFFVISGMVVTKTVIRQVKTNSFSILNFYSKRIKRLVPLLTVVNVVSLLLVVIFLSPFGEIQKALSTVRWSTFFSANIELLRADSYTNLVGNPFRHLWSLAVEEQFYLFYPLLVFGIIAIKTKLPRVQFETLLRTILIVVFFISAIYCYQLSADGIGTSSIRLAFFSMPARIWEFACGAILATYGKSGQRVNSKTSYVLGVTGIILLLWSFVSINSLIVFPGWATIAPVFGTGFLLFIGDTNTFINKIISFKPFVYLGDLSYGWYLWHWPLVVVAEIVFPNNAFSLVIASLVALMLARFCFVNFENPIRRSERVGKGLSFVILGATCILVLGLLTGIQVAARSGFGLRAFVDIDRSAQRDTVLRNRPQCSIENEEDAFRFMNLTASEFVASCSNGAPLQQGRHPDIILVGDSQADTYADGLFQAGRELNLSTYGYFADGCPFIARAPLRSSEYCNDLNKHVLTLLAELKPAIVVVTNRYDFLATNLDEMNNRVPYLDASLPKDISDQLVSISMSLTDMIASVKNSTDEIVVITDLANPSLPARTLFEKTPFSRNTGNDPYSEVRLIRDQINVLITSDLEKESQVTLLNLSGELCDESGFCSGADEGKPIFVDENHLNATGSKKLTPAWIGLLQTIQPD